MQEQNQLSDLELTIQTYLNLDRNARATAKALSLPRSTVRNRLKKAKNNPKYKALLSISEDFKVTDTNILNQQIQELRRQLVSAQKNTLLTEQIKKFVLKLKNSDPIYPEWLDSEKINYSDKTVANIIFSDWHFGEMVNGAQIFGVNEYNIAIAKERVNRVVDKTIDLAFNHLANPNYAGIIVHLLGDMQSGLIHEELKITGEKEVLQIVLELYGVLIEAITKLVDAFGKAFIPCVAGNHGRLTLKPRAKNYAFDNLDWILYQLLAKWFENDKRVKFLVSDGEDAQFKVYDWTFRITHGSQFKGGDGLVGPSSTIIRNNYKKKAQLSGLNEDFDLLICGHFHQYIQLSNVICNSSLIGLNEYAFKSGFQAEPPQQAFFITTKDIKIAFPMPILAEEPKKKKDKNWVSWEE